MGAADSITVYGNNSQTRRGGHYNSPASCRLMRLSQFKEAVGSNPTEDLASVYQIAPFFSLPMSASKNVMNTVPAIAVMGLDAEPTADGAHVIVRITDPKGGHGVFAFPRPFLTEFMGRIAVALAKATK